MSRGPEGPQRELGRPGAQTVASMEACDTGEQSVHLERWQGLQGCRVFGVMLRLRGLKAMVWNLDFTLRMGTEAT